MIVSVLGDSVATKGWPATLAAKMGWTLNLFGLTGTGYVNDGGVGGSFEERLPSALAVSPNIVFVQGSSNDNSTVSASDLSAACTRVFATINATGARIIAMGLNNEHWLMPLNPELITNQAATKAAALAAGALWFSPTDLGWFTGTGDVLHGLKGDGNGDVYCADYFHPTVPAGANYLAARIAQVLKPPSTGLDF